MKYHTKEMHEGRIKSSSGSIPPLPGQRRLGNQKPKALPLDINNPQAANPTSKNMLGGCQHLPDRT